MATAYNEAIIMNMGMNIVDRIARVFNHKQQLKPRFNSYIDNIRFVL